MKAQDLRIGNWVKRGSHEFRVAALDDNELILTETRGLYQQEDIHPIPLTEEWLKAFGFSVDPTLQIAELFIDDDISITIDYGILQGYIAYTDIDGECNILPISRCCKYIHLLQNIVHSLTGKELEKK